MNEIHSIISCLETTPSILNYLLNQIPRKLFEVRRIKNKWSIHEQLCHLVEAPGILMQRFEKFKTEKNPLIKSYNPGSKRSPTYYLKLNMKVELDKFPIIREEMIQTLRNYDKSYWNLKGRHEVFAPYNNKILLTHTLNVDYAHIFCVEQLGLTKAAFENEIITIT
jgi:hypothetical protein